MPKDRRHAAIMFTDIVGYTSMMGSDEDKAFEVLSKNREIHTKLITQYNGTLIKEMGDGMLISFNLASDAVYCAIEIQKKCKELDIPLKIGIHEGEMVFEGADVIGDAVNVASRLESDSHEGCIYISGSVFRDIKNRSDINTKYIKDKKFKNVDEPIKVYEIICDDGAEPGQQTNTHDKRGNPKSKNPYYLIAGIVVISIIVLFVWKSIPSYKTVGLEKSIAVLPFKYLSEDESKQYLSDGVMDAITGHLSKIDRLIVRPRTSVEQYRDTEKTSQIIGEELGVSYLIEGSFLMVENQVKLTIQLINVKDDDHMFFQEYDRDYNDIMAVQSEVAQTIAKKVAVVISPETKEIIETDPTNDLTAYDYYLKGKEYQQRSTYEEDLRIAIQMYETAVNLDSSFVLAWVGLASAHRWIYWGYHDRSEKQLLRIKKYLDYAISLSPKLMEVQLEEGSYYYHCKNDYPKALQILEPLESKYPNDEKIYQMIGNVYRRMGDYNKSLEYYNHAISLNPSNWNLWHNVSITHRILRKYDDAENCYKRSIELNPSYHLSQRNLLRMYANTGQIEKAKEFLKNNQRFIDHPDIKLTQAYIEILDRNFEEAIQIIESLSEEVLELDIYYYTKHLQLGLIYHMMSNKVMTIKHFESEKDFLLDKIEVLKNDSRVYRSLGIAYAGLGLKKEAMEAGEKALEILSFSNDALKGYHTELDMVKILVMVGEYEDALTRLKYIISKSGHITADVLQLDPFWNPIREMDGFQKIINNPVYQVNLSDN